MAMMVRGRRHPGACLLVCGLAVRGWCCRRPCFPVAVVAGVALVLDRGWETGGRRERWADPRRRRRWG